MALGSQVDHDLVEAYLAGDVTGQVAIGNNILQVKAEKGAVVTVSMPEDLPVIEARGEPIRRLSAYNPDLLGREAELEQAIDAVRAGEPLQFYGASGIGKTSLLYTLCHQLGGDDQWPAVLFSPARRFSVQDLLQFAFDEL